MQAQPEPQAPRGPLCSPACGVGPWGHLGRTCSRPASSLMQMLLGCSHVNGCRRGDKSRSLGRMGPFQIQHGGWMATWLQKDSQRPEGRQGAWEIKHESQQGSGFIWSLLCPKPGTRLVRNKAHLQRLCIFLV